MGRRGRMVGRTERGMDTKPHAVRDSRGGPLNVFATAGQVRRYTGARALPGRLQGVDRLLGGLGNDADRFRERCKTKGYVPVYPVEISASSQ